MTNLSDMVPPGQDQSYLMRRLADLEREVRELKAARRLESATIGAGGLTIKAGGQVLIEDAAGDPIIWLGKVPFSDGTTKPGLVAFRAAANGGHAAMSLYDGIFAAWDRAGNIVLSTDEVSGQGHARPWLPIPFTGSDYTVWPGSTSATFQRIGEARVSRQQPKVYALLSHTTDTSGTTGEVRLLCNGTQLGPTISVGFVIAYANIGPLELPAGTYGDTLQFSVEARRIAGTGKVKATVAGAWTQQS